MCIIDSRNWTEMIKSDNKRFFGQYFSNTNIEKILNEGIFNQRNLIRLENTFDKHNSTFEINTLKNM